MHGISSPLCLFWGREAIESGKAIEKLRHWVFCQDSTGGLGMAKIEALLDRAAVK